MNKDPEFLAAAEAARVVERITGKRPHAASIWRWASRGVSGVRLRTVYALGSRRTTEQWIREFFDAVGKARTGTGDTRTGGVVGSDTEGSQANNNRVKAAEARLAKAGM